MVLVTSFQLSSWPTILVCLSYLTVHALPVPHVWRPCVPYIINCFSFLYKRTAFFNSTSRWIKTHFYLKPNLKKCSSNIKNSYVFFPTYNVYPYIAQNISHLRMYQIPLTNRRSIIYFDKLSCFWPPTNKKRSVVSEAPRIIGAIVLLMSFSSDNNRISFKCIRKATRITRTVAPPL